MITDRTSWAVKGADIVSELMTLINVTDEEKDLLKALQATAREQSPGLLDAFYGRLLSHGNTAEYLRNVPLEHLHATLTNWFLDIFSGDYNEQYAQKRLKIGQVHVHIGLPVRYPLAMIDVIMQYGEQATNASSNPALAFVAFKKVLSLDIAIFNQAYEDNQLKYLAEMVGGERLARLLLSGNG